MRAFSISLIALFLFFASCEKECNCIIEETNSKTSTTTLEFNEPVIEEHNIHLSWSVSGDDIFYLEVFRHEGSPEDLPLHNLLQIARSTEPILTETTDYEVPFTPIISYMIYGYSLNPDNPELSKLISGDTIQVIRDIPFVNFNPDDAIHYPEKNKILLINKENGNIASYDYNTGSSVMVKLKSGLGQCMLYTNGERDELLVPREDGWLFIYDPGNFQVLEQYKVTHVPLTSVVQKDNRIICSTGEYQKSMIILDKQTKEILSNNTYLETSQEMSMVMMPGEGLQLACAASGYIHFLEYDMNGQRQSINSYSTNFSPYLPVRGIKVLPGTQSVICYPSGLIYDKASGQVSGLPRGNLKFSHMLTTEDGTHIVTACDNYRSLEVYNLNDMSHAETLVTNGYPKYLFPGGNGDFIVISKPSLKKDFFYESMGVVVERIKR
jgi:hypothetical protein